MTASQNCIVILLLAAATAITRFVPFIIFGDSHKTPKYIHYLGNALPAAIFSMLVVYCLKGVSLISAPHGLPELIAIAVTAALHLKFDRLLLSIAGGTVCYMALIQFVF